MSEEPPDAGGAGTTTVRTLWRNVFENALDFLEHSIEELESRPKYAVISFATGVELTLKARLLREHWTLVLKRPGEVSLKDFGEGKFQSVTVADAIKRLGSVAALAFSSTERAAYDAVRNHRNRLVHFFHADYAKKLSDAESETLQREQFDAWCYLRRRIKEWPECESAYVVELSVLDIRLRQNWVFLQSKFRHAEPDLADARSRGAVVATCPNCKLAAAELREDGQLATVYYCHVCERNLSAMSLTCPECDSHFPVFEFCEGACSCGEFEPDIDWVIDELVASGLAAPDLESDGPFCAECLTLHRSTILQAGTGELMCAFCLVTHEEFEQCEWCSTAYVGTELQFSYTGGCELCDGLAGQRSYQ